MKSFAASDIPAFQTILDTSAYNLSTAYILYQTLSLFFALVREGNFACEHFVDQHTEAPQINSLVIVSSLCHLWWQIGRCIDFCCSPISTDAGQSKIWNLGASLRYGIFLRQTIEYFLVWYPYELCPCRPAFVFHCWSRTSSWRYPPP